MENTITTANRSKVEAVVQELEETRLALAEARETVVKLMFKASQERLQAPYPDEATGEGLAYTMHYVTDMLIDLKHLDRLRRKIEDAKIEITFCADRVETLSEWMRNYRNKSVDNK